VGLKLQHAPFRKYYDDLDHVGCLLPDLESEIRLVEMYGTSVLAVTLNGEGGSSEQLTDYAVQTQEQTGIPMIRPIEEGVDRLLPIVEKYIAGHDHLSDVTRIDR